MHQYLAISLCISFLFSLSYGQSACSYTFPQAVSPYNRVKFSVNTSLFPANQSLTLQILTDFIGDNTTSNASAFTPSNTASLQSGTGVNYFQVWNYNMVFSANIQVQVFANKTSALSPYCIIAQMQSNKEMLIASILTQDISSSFMLPFNLFSYKVSYFLLLQIKSTSFTANEYQTEPFMQTYWNQIQDIVILMPWLPYFSQCLNSKSRIMLYDLIVPEECVIGQFMGFQSTQCTNKFITSQCLVQELELPNPDMQFWFNNQNHILYYLMPKPISIDRFNEYNTTTTQVYSLDQSYYADLVPMVYQRQSSNSIKVNCFDITFKVIVGDKFDSFSITSATIIGSYNADTSPKGSLTISVEYLTAFQIFFYFQSPSYVYIIVSSVISAFFIIILYVLQSMFTQFNLKQKFKLIIYPIGKGLIFFLLSAYLYIELMYFISQSTNFNTISSTFSQNFTGDQLIQNNKGRNALMIFFAGAFIANSSINQAFKVPSIQEIKIIIEDNTKENQSSIQQNQKTVNQKGNFIIKNLNGHRKYIFFWIFLLCLQIVFIYYLCYNLSPTLNGLINLTVLPFIQKLIIIKIKKYVVRDLLYIQGIEMAFQVFLIVICFTSKDYLGFLGLYLSRFITYNVFSLLIQVGCDYLCRTLNDKPDRNLLVLKFYLFFQDFIKGNAQESQYQRSLYYSAFFTAKIAKSFLLPFFLLFIYISLNTNYLPDQLLITQTYLQHAIWTLVAFSPCEVYFVLAMINIFQKYFKIKIDYVISFNHFKFKSRKLKWMNDYFNHNKDINPFYRQFQKFCFSSQLYFISYMLSFGMCMVGLGFKIFISSSYIMFNDPALLVIIIVAWLVGYILSFIASFIALKLKLYEIKEEEITRSKLNKVDKYLKKYDYFEYLQIEGVKRHFLHFNMNWIINNLNKILNKEDFYQNSSQLLNKYKYYKSQSKMKSIQEKRRKKESKENEEITQENPLKAETNLVIKIPQKKFQKYAKPLFYSWFFLAKQNLYLKSIVEMVRKEKIKEICEFCNMDIQLQAIEKKEFQDIVNNFRVVNVGNIFAESSFLQFYRENQQFITVCVECKDKKMYLQKKSIKNAKGVPSKLILRWLFIARSKLLHQKHIKK